MPVALRYIVVEPPPSRLIAWYAPRPFMSVASSVQVIPADAVERPSTTTMYTVLPSCDKPTAVRGFRVGQAGLDVLVVILTPALTSCGCPDTTHFIHVESNASTSPELWI